MASSSSRAFPQGIKITLVTVAFIFSLSTQPPKSVGSVSVYEHPMHGGEQRNEGERTGKMGLGSRPPRCENKCFNCRPCMATLVVPVHQMKKRSQTTSRGEDDSYYLLSWKCRCGNKLFQP